MVSSGERSSELGECGYQPCQYPSTPEPNMVRASREMFLKPGRDGVDRAVRDERVHQRVTARLGDVGLGEAEPLPVVSCIRQVQVDLQRLAADCARLVRVGGQHHLVFRGQEGVGPDELARPARCAPVSLDTGGRPALRLADSLSTCGPVRRPPTVLRNAVFVELVQVLGERVVRLLLLLVRLGMADADAE